MNGCTILSRGHDCFKGSHRIRYRSPRGDSGSRSYRCEADHSRCLSWEAGVSSIFAGMVERPME
jgi:hypothetical protein